MSRHIRRLVSMTMTGILLQTLLLPAGTPVAFAAGNEAQRMLGIDSPAYVIPKGWEIAQEEARSQYVPGQVLVKFKDGRMDLSSGTGKQRANTFAKNRKFKMKDVVARQNLGVLTIEGTETVEQAVDRLEADPNVEYAEPNYTQTLMTIPTNDTFRDQLWALDNVGQTVNGVASLSGADMNVPQAWAISEGQNAPSPIIVAVIDTGVMYTHTDLSGAMWDGSSCVDENGAALGGCQHGYDFADNDKDPSPVYSTTSYYPHGTEVSGVIAATKNNNTGVIGIAPRVKIMALRFGFDTASEVRAIDFAIKNGAKVINASYGGYGLSLAERDAITRFRTSGGLFVASAGNDANDNDLFPLYPASHDLDNIVSVAATNQQDGVASFSSYGVQSVDVGAPGVNIDSTTTTIPSVTLLSETFEGENVVPPEAPTGWVKTGNWGTFRVGQGFTVLYTDLTNVPYVPNANSTVTSQTYDLGGAASASIQLDTRCDSEYAAGTDYVALEVSSNTGGSFTELQRWNESTLDNDSDPVGFSPVRRLGITVPPLSISSTFTFRLRWVTNGNSDTGTFGDGCYIDNIKLFKNSAATEGYIFEKGTSFSSPYTAGLAGLIMGYNPALTASEVKAIILSSGDSLPVLAGKTVTGKRINAEKALRAADTVAPVITLLGNPTVSLTVGGTYTDSGATALDNLDGNITARIVTTNPVNTAISGSYIVRYNVSDAAGNAATEVTRTVNVTAAIPVPDTTAPVITLLGSSPVDVVLGTTYTDAGATATDDRDGNITARIVAVSTVNTAVIGNYTVKYNVADAAGNAATEVTRTVNVIPVPTVPDTTAPVITLLGSSPVDVVLGTTYTDAGATATDDRDGDITTRIVAVSTVNTAVIGNYTVKYNVADAAGNAAAEVTRTVNVIAPPPPPDTTAPVIMILGNITVILNVGDAYVDAGATATDNIDGDLTANIVTVSTVNTAVAGTYTVKYNVADAAGNAAPEVARTVIVNAVNSGGGDSGGGNPGGGTPPPSGNEPTVSDNQTSTSAPAILSGGHGHGGHGTMVFFGMAAFAARQHGLRNDLAPGSFGGGDAALTTAETEYICSMQRALPARATDAVIRTIAGAMTVYLGRTATFIADQLQSPTLCVAINAALRPVQTVKEVAQLKPFAVAADGAPVSSNPLWNLCVRDLPLTFADIQQNPDVDARGRHYSCDHYHPSQFTWRHPDLKVLFLWNPKTRALTLPKGYTADKSKKDVSLGMTPLIAAAPRSPEEEMKL